MTADDQNIGRLVAGRYRLDAILGRGGFGSVYQGWDTQIGRDVAVKLLDIESSARTAEQTAELRERFRREAMAAGRINHPGIVTIFDFGIPEGSEAYLVMELLEGHDLAYELDNKGPLMPDRALRLFVPLLEALGRGHEMGIVHKDIKPQNVFLRSPGSQAESLCLVDFGVARVVHEDKLTMTGLLVGTPQYMAPEYITDTLVTPALDVYQVGLILAEAITGVPAVPLDEPFVRSCNRHFTGDLDIPEGLYDGPFGAVLRGALQPNPTDRIPDATEFMERLAEVDPRTIVLDTTETQLFNRGSRRVSTFAEPPLFPPMNPEQVSRELEREAPADGPERDPSSQFEQGPNTPAPRRPESQSEVDPFGPTQFPDHGRRPVSVRAEANAQVDQKTEEAERSRDSLAGDFEGEQRSPGRVESAGPPRSPMPAAKLPRQLDSDVHPRADWEWGDPTVTADVAPGADPRGGGGGTVALVVLVLTLLLVGGGVFAYVRLSDEAPQDSVVKTAPEKPESTPKPTSEAPPEVEKIPVLELASEPPGAQVFAGEAPIAETPAEIVVDDLEVQSLELRLEGYEPESVPAAAGNRTVTLRPAAKKAKKSRKSKPSTERPKKKAPSRRSDSRGRKSDADDGVSEAKARGLSDLVDDQLSKVEAKAAAAEAEAAEATAEANEAVPEDEATTSEGDDDEAVEQTDSEGEEPKRKSPTKWKLRKAD